MHSRNNKQTFIYVCMLVDCHKMNVGTASSENNPTHSYFNSKGMWLFYTLLVGLLHWIVLSIPFISVAVAWTLTNVIHNAVSYLPFLLFYYIVMTSLSVLLLCC